MVLCRVLAPWTITRPDGTKATAGDRIILGDARAQRLAEQAVVAVVEPIGGRAARGLDDSPPV